MADVVDTALQLAGLLSHSFQSSAFVRGTYQRGTGQMDLTFQNGRTYSYYEVPFEVWDGLTNADSPGSYFHANIKDQYGE
jgi:KTSC domain